MPEPINYMAQLPRPDIAGNLLQGLQVGAQFQQIQQARQAQIDAENLKRQYSEDLQQAMSNPTPESFAMLTAKYPGQREAFKQSWDMMSQGQKDNEFLTGVQAYSAITSGKPEVAKSLLETQITAARNSGKDTRKLETMMNALDQKPESVAGHLGLVLSSVDPEKWSKMAGELRTAEKAPAELSEAKSKAAIAASKAKFADSEAVLDLQKKGWDITKIQEDIKIAKQNANIAAMNAQISKTGNDLKRQELQLKVQEHIQKRDEAVNAKAADVESARMNMDNMLNTADRILKTDPFVISRATGPVASSKYVPTVTQGAADFEALVDTLGSQAFLAQIPNIKGMGALSNAEGEKLQSALQNFSLKQSPERLLENVREAQRLILKARSNISKRYGVPESIPDTPQAPGAADGGKSADEILRELGVM